MTTEAEQLTVTVHLGDEQVSLAFFVHTSEDLGKLLRAIEQARLGESRGAYWVVNTSELQLGVSANGVSAVDLGSIITDAYEGIRAVEANDRAAFPSTFDANARMAASRFVNRIRKTRSEPVFLEDPGQEPVYIEPEASAASITASEPRRRRKSYAAWSSVDGKLDVISVHRTAHFVIFEHGSNNQVQCLFPDDWMPTVKDSLDKRVVVEGYLHYRPNGSARSLTDPKSIRKVPAPDHPSILDLRGSLPGLSGDMSSVEYIRRLRDGERGG
jgi:hypothetical protein